MEFDVVIVGGGLVGASLAASLKTSGLKLALIEGLSPPGAPVGSNDWDARIYAITPGNAKFLQDCGAWQHLDINRVQQVEEMRVFGDGGAELDFSAYQIGAAELTFILESRLLQQAIWHEIQHQDNLTIINPARCATVEWRADAAHLSLADGRQIQAKLIVGADGRDSWIRQQAGMPEVPTPYHQHGLVANFTTEKAHHGTAYQWFQPDGILAFLPLPDKKISIVWSVSPEKAQTLLTASADVLCEQVGDASKSMLGKLTLITPPSAFSLRVLNLAHLVKPRLALIGDAAHNVHPLSGQGVNLGFRDARKLAEVLLARGALECGDLRLLNRYDRLRRNDIMSMQLTTDALHHLFMNRNPVLCTLRNFGLSALDALSPLKKILARHALN